ncbi:MAG TPA: cytochrome oxidase small assembly protein [Burkholderiales bacterium]|nr:cytochrome oxidase small assembly protein [Burkholderiales bacterium]
MALSKNAKTGLILATIALAWFAGLILKYWIMDV